MIHLERASLTRLPTLASMLSNLLACPCDTFPASFIHSSIMNASTPHTSTSALMFNISSTIDRCTLILFPALPSCSFSSTASTATGGSRPSRCARFHRFNRAIPVHGYMVPKPSVIWSTCGVVLRQKVADWGKLTP